MVQMLSFAHRVCVLACVREGDMVTQPQACLQTHLSFINVSVTRLCSPFGLELMVKLRTLLTVFIFILITIMVRGVTFPTRACGVQPITISAGCNALL